MPISTMLNRYSLMTIFDDSIVIYVKKPFIYPFQVVFLPHVAFIIYARHR